MKKLATLILVLIIASINALGQTVYISTGSSAKKYHSTSSCRGLANSKYIKSISIEDAHGIGRTPCMICMSTTTVKYKEQHKTVENERQSETESEVVEIADIRELLDTMEIFKRPTADEIWEDFKNTSIIAKQDTVETTIISDSIDTPQTDEIWESYENAVRYIKYNDASYLETTYFKIENLLYANKREMRSLPKDSNELKLKKQQIKVMKSKMEEIDNKYIELTNKYIYQG